MFLTIEQQFEKRKYIDVVKTLNEEQLLEILKDANLLLQQKSFCFESFVENNKLDFIDTEDTSFKFGQLLKHREFEKYNREELVEVLLGTIETIMFLDNQFKTLWT